MPELLCQAAAAWELPETGLTSELWFVQGLSWLVPSTAQLWVLVALSAGAHNLSLCCVQQAQFKDFICFTLRNLFECWKASEQVQLR